VSVEGRREKGGRKEEWRGERRGEGGEGRGRTELKKEESRDGRREGGEREEGGCVVSWALQS